MTGSQAVGFADDETQSISRQVLEVVAAEAGTTPLALETPLYEVVDPDALDALYGANGAAPTIEFTYLGYSVSIDGEGDVSVSNPNAE